MDYSLLLGLHFRSPQLPAAIVSQKSTDISTQRGTAGSKEGAVDKFPETKASFGDIRAAEALLLVTHESNVNGLPAVVSQADAHPFGEQKTARLQTQLGVNMPAKADSKPLCNGKARSNLDQREAHDVVLYFGIIDILQQYDMGKKLERAYKSLQYDPLSISSVDPSLYSRRFQNFIRKTFPGSATC